MGRFDLFGWWCAWVAALRAANGEPWWRGWLVWGVGLAGGALVLDRQEGPLASLAAPLLFLALALWVGVFYRVARKGPDTLFIFVAGLFALTLLLRLVHDLVRLASL